jgi:Holliday junction resolvase RusA-like endonuclease
MPDIILNKNPKGDILRFEFPGKPMAHQSVRFGIAMDKSGDPIYKLTKNNKKRIVTVKYQDKEIENQKAFIKWCIVQQRPFGFELWREPVAILKLHHVFPRTIEARKLKPIDGYVFRDLRPDLPDNLNKLLFDCLTNLIYYDDKQIVSIDEVKKYYGDPPGSFLTIKKLKI